MFAGSPGSILRGALRNSRAAGPAMFILDQAVESGIVQATPPAGVVTVGSITAAQIASFNANYPLVLANHVLFAAENDAAFATRWSTTGSWTSGADLTASDSPGYNAYDFQFNRFTAPSSAQSTWYFLMNFGGTPATIDAAVILGHNFGAIGGLTVTLEVADDAAFTTNLRTLATWTPGTSTKRLVNVTLGGSNNSYSGVVYARVKITGSSAFIPQIGEIFLGARRQLNSAGLLPYDPDMESARTVDFDGRSGVRTRYVFNDGQQTLKFDLSIADASSDAVVSSWWSDCAHGTRPFVYIERPNTAPGAAFLMWFPQGYKLQRPYLSDVVRRLSVELEEQGAPFYANES